MTRLTSLAVVIALTGTAFAQSQAEIAARLNDEGKQLLYADKPAEAAKKFQEAVARVPEARYFVNLCAARLQEGKLDDALTACNAVELNGPSPSQKANAAKLVEKINEEAKKQNLELHPTGGGCTAPCTPATDPRNQQQVTTGNPNPRPNETAPPQPFRPAVGRPLGQSLVAAGTPDNQYTWTLGIDLLAGGGRIGQTDFYGSAAVGFRIKGDYMLVPPQRIGMQVYLQELHLGPGKNDNAFADQLDVVDLGLAGYKHLCLGSQSRACITPLIGAQLSLMSPAGAMDSTGSRLFNYLAVGGRAEVSFAYALGSHFEHVISVIGGVQLYSQVLQGPSANDGSGSLTIQEAGLDAGGAVGYLGLGYTYRFNTPIGSTPFVILE